VPVSTLRMTGVAAVVQWGYHEAAALGAWELTDGLLRAAVRSSNPVHLAQAPLYFIVENRASGQPPFARQLLDATLNGSTLTGRLGPRKG
jgi:hypothetical protein